MFNIFYPFKNFCRFYPKCRSQLSKRPKKILFILQNDFQLN